MAYQNETPTSFAVPALKKKMTTLTLPTTQHAPSISGRNPIVNPNRNEFEKSLYVKTRFEKANFSQDNPTASLMKHISLVRHVSL